MGCEGGELSIGSQDSIKRKALIGCIFSDGMHD